MEATQRGKMAPPYPDDVERGYADNMVHNHGATDLSPGERELHFRTEFQPLADLPPLLAPLDRYGRFRAEAVLDRLRRLEDQGVDVTVSVGRESSPALYVASDNPAAVELAFQGAADEVDQRDRPAVAPDGPIPDAKLVRLWWD